MPSQINTPAIPLPKSWPRRVRSAVIHAISLAQAALTFTRSQAANSVNARIRLKEENDRLRQEVALLREEMRIKDSRMEQIPAQRRPHYPPTERLAILELRSVRGWSLAQTATRFLVTAATIASWTDRLDEEGADALVQLRVPVNKFPDLVAYLVRRFKTLCPAMGKVKIAQTLARAGLHVAATTVGRMLRDKPKRRAPAKSGATGRSVIAKHPNYAWNIDLTTVPTALGFWIPWLPGALPQCWPFCWWVAVAIDHCSRRIMGMRIFKSEPTSAAMIAFLASTFRKHGQPRHLITDHGSQFTAADFVTWCRRRNIDQRFGALGKYGSLAVVERCIRTIKRQCT